MTTDTNRELLELAAKAAGIRLEWIGDTLFDCTKLKAGKPTCKGALWMPLHDDGDALRLAVRLRLSIESDAAIEIEFWPGIGGDYAEGCEAWIVLKDGTSTKAQELYGTDPYAATRRAIVRAAAEIGRAMP